MIERLYKLTMLLAGIGLALSVVFGTGAMRDNGDYYRRVLRCTGLEAEDPRFSDRYRAVQPHPRACGLATPLVAVVGTVRLGMAVLEQPLLPIQLTASLFCALWLCGVILTLRHPMAWQVPWALPALLLVTAAYAGYFRSLYEELNVLVLLPFLLLGFWRWQTDRRPALLLVSLCLLAVSKVQMAGALPFMLVMLWSRAPSRRPVWLMTTAMIGLSALVIVRWDLTAMNLPNVYDRFYNGIGLALQGVGDWPVRTSPGRRSYSREHRDALQSLTAAFEPDADQPRMGTSYARTGALAARDLIAQGKPEELDRMLAPGRLGGMLAWLATHPRLWPVLATQVIMVTARADYRLLNLEDQLSLTPLDPLRDLLRRWGGATVLGAVVLIALSRRRLQVPLIFATTLPTAVWLGSGFFEFERHMAPFWMLLPLLVGADYADWWGRYAARPPGPEPTAPGGVPRVARHGG